MQHWITTHWPGLPQDAVAARHVYVKQRHLAFPLPGDVVFVRESVTVRGKASPTVLRVHNGVRQQVKVPLGFGGLVARVSVKGSPRAIIASDVVYDYGDLREWSKIDCVGHQSLRVPLPSLMKALGYSSDATPRFMDLWKVPDSKVGPLLSVVDSI